MLKFPYEVWIDGLYIVQSFCFEYDLYFNNGEYLKEIMQQFKNVYETNRDVKTGLYYHGFDETRWTFWADDETGCSGNFWLRALG